MRQQAVESHLRKGVSLLSSETLNYSKRSVNNVLPCSPLEHKSGWSCAWVNWQSRLRTWPQKRFSYDRLAKEIGSTITVTGSTIQVRRTWRRCASDEEHICSKAVPLLQGHKRAFYAAGTYNRRLCMYCLLAIC